ncbi:MAG: hypothetical protein ASARMPRED_000896 [Alectoria sarmentosa]|nr:MAG: hypothetical protein ASARMPRED_000896 [Alectoria sarmentosa]
MSHFMRIPPEVRAFIYEHCLAIGKIYPYREKQSEEVQEYAGHLNTSATPLSCAITKGKKSNAALCLGIRQVNKTTYEEVTPIMYKRNTVVLPRAPLAAKFFHNCLDSVEKRLWLKDVELELCASDISLQEWNNSKQFKGLDLPCGMVPSSTLEQEGKLAKKWHNIWKQHLADVVWPEKLAPILDDTKLDKLTVKFAKSKCAALCCYMDKQACAAFQRGFANGMVKHISLHNLALHDLGEWQDPDPESFKRGDREIEGTVLATVSDAEGEEDLDRDVIQMGEQIARWTRARKLGVADGTRRWFQAVGQKDDEEDEDEE